MNRVLAACLAAGVLAWHPAVSASPPPPPPPAADAAPPTAKIEAGGVIGRRVLGPDKQELGRVVDVLVDANSQPRAAVIDFGGFLGVGIRRIAVDWSDLSFPPTGTPGDIQLDMSADRLRNAPAYTDQTKPATVVQPQAAPSPSGH